MEIDDDIEDGSATPGMSEGKGEINIADKRLAIKTGVSVIYHVENAACCHDRECRR